MRVVFLAMLMGCSEPPAPDPARPFEYQVWFDTTDVAVQTLLAFNGETVGRVTHVKQWEPGRDLSFGTMTLPMNWRDDPDATLSMTALTPCGPQQVPLELDGPATSTIKLKTPTADVLPKATEVYQTWGRGVSIGQAELLPGQGDSWSVSGLDCASEHALTVNGEPKGTITTPDAIDYVFIGASTDACYVYTSAVYTESGGGTREVPLTGRLAYGLERRVEHVMEEVPETIRVDRTTAQVGTVATYLTEVPCPTP